MPQSILTALVYLVTVCFWQHPLACSALAVLGLNPGCVAGRAVVHQTRARAAAGTSRPRTGSTWLGGQRLWVSPSHPGKPLLLLAL